jgi:hypothetical protein
MRINRIEKPRGLESYKKIFGDKSEVLCKEEFNDKYLLLIKKPEK